MDVDQLLPRELLVKTSDLDQADWNYRTGPLGTISRRRFDLVVELLGTGHGSLLEVGYGSGVAMPLLAKHTREVHGVDVHDHPDDVARSLRSVGVTADLVTGSVTDLPYPDARFDAVVSISSLEFVDAIDTACVEMARVLRPGGVGVFVTPGYSRALDLGLRVLSGERAEDTFHGRRQRVLPALERAFDVQRRHRIPPGPLWMYTAVRATSR